MDRLSALRAELVAAIVEKNGVTETEALPFVNAVLVHLQDLYGGERVYIPAPRAKHDMAALEAALRSSTPTAVARKFGTSRATAYRLKSCLVLRRDLDESPAPCPPSTKSA